MNNKDLLELLKRLNKPRLESWLLYAEVAARFMAGLLVVFAFIWMFRSCTSEPRITPRVNTRDVQAIIHPQSLSSLRQTKYELWHENERLQRSNNELKSSIDSRKAELDRLDQDVKALKKKLANKPQIKKEMEEEVRQATFDYLSARDDELAEKARREGERAGHSSGIVTGALLYHLFK